MTPLPWKTMVVLCLVILSEPVSLTLLFPFVYFMVRDFGIPEKDIGFYVGFIASSFSCAQLLTSFGWGWISDRIGRRPVLLIGLAGNTLTMLAFGVSKSLGWAIATRSLCGFLNGNIGIAKSVLGEISDESNRSNAFALIGLNFGIGMLIGPSLGGLLSNPTRFELLKDIVFLDTYPYFLPCFCASMISVCGFAIGYTYLPETLKKSQSFAESVDDEEEPLISESCVDGDFASADAVQDAVFEHENTLTNMWPAENTPPVEKKKTRRRIGLPAIWASLAYGLLAFQNILFIEVFPLWAVAKPGIGLGYSAQDIGICLSFIGLFSLVCQIVCYPPLARRVSTLMLFRIPNIGLILVFGCLPIVSSVLTVDPNMEWLVTPSLYVLLGLRTLIENITFTSVMILVNLSAPEGQLGSVNGVAQGTASFARMIGPALGGTMWAWSNQSGMPFPLNHHFLFAFEILMVCIMVLHSWILLTDKSS